MPQIIHHLWLKQSKSDLNWKRWHCMSYPCMHNENYKYCALYNDFNHDYCVIGICKFLYDFYDIERLEKRCGICQKQ